MGTKIKKMKIERRGPDSEPKMRYFKIPLCRLFLLKIRAERCMNVELNGTCQWHLRSKIGVWQMPLFKFLCPEIWRWNLWFDESKRLKYKYTIFDLRCYECSWCNYECRMTKMICFEWKGIPKFVEERDPTPLGDIVVSLGKMIVHHRVDSCMKINETKTRSWIDIGKFWNIFVNWWFVETDILIGDISGPDTLGWHFWGKKGKFKLSIV